MFSLQILSKKTNFHENFKKIFKQSPLWNQGLPDHKKFVKFGRTLNVCLKKGGFFIRFLAKVRGMLKKMNYWKWRNTIFNVPFIIKQMFLWLQFATNLLSIADITHSFKNKYLIFFKLENIGQILDKLCKDIKGLQSSREWIKKLQSFS